MGICGSGRGAGTAARGGCPTDLLSPAKGANDKAPGREACSADEVDCRAGQLLIGSARVHGCVWCRGSDGTEVWVPAGNLAALDG